MKTRCIGLLLAAALLLGLLSGCASSVSPWAMLLYYRAAEVGYGENGLIDTEAAGVRGVWSPETLAERYFEGPETESLVSPFPKGAALVRAQLENGVLHMTLSREFGNLTGADLSLALSCITLTFSQLTGVEAVELSAERSLIGGQSSVKIRPDQILRVDNSEEIAENTLNIYYADSQNRYLIASEVKTKLSTVPEQAALALSMLGEQPSNDGLQATLPENTELLDLSIEDGVCIVDFSGDFYRNRPENDAAERMTVLSIVNTLTEFPGIESVQFFVEGETLKTYSHMDLSLQYVRDETAIGPVRAGLNEVDASLYVIRRSDGKLMEIPTRIKSAANENEMDAVLSALLHYGEKNGYLSPLPPGTHIRSVTEQGNHCYVDLSKSFAAGLITETEEILAVQSIVSSLTSLEHIRYVTLTIEGQAGGLRYVRLDEAFFGQS